MRNVDLPSELAKLALAVRVAVSLSDIKLIFKIFNLYIL